MGRRFVWAHPGGGEPAAGFLADASASNSRESPWPGRRVKKIGGSRRGRSFIQSSRGSRHLFFANGLKSRLFGFATSAVARAHPRAGPELRRQLSPRSFCRIRRRRPCLPPLPESRRFVEPPPAFSVAGSTSSTAASASSAESRSAALTHGWPATAARRACQRPAGNSYRRYRPASLRAFAICSRSPPGYPGLDSACGA